ncbi:hypothetical protein C8J30_101346 [Rhodobacter viridis]|uniref:Uncharacterized protein n=1 Tax=Rhodobacter viridis TaxID=1054202 RepID=A0A318U2Z8_9RHOB|nr:hypothetical protein [Rhodobacter viridis]PYF12962.1 hypothetical protein C8J30_101346 [Rhodobacter viridis]
MPPGGSDRGIDPFATDQLSLKQVEANAHLATGDLTVLTLEKTRACDLVSANAHPPYEVQQAIEITGTTGADHLP